ncbi:MAG: cytidine deaminase [Bacteroidaceae bacterium]|nr:cytidine deaminase [Bacteroidaceae bacterium]
MKQLRYVCEVKVCGLDELSSSDRELVEAARMASFSSYSPYSGFAVGAAVRLSGGAVVTGSNQENVAYPSGLCAERTALFSASVQYPDCAIEVLALAGRTSEGFTEHPCTPCGACRQVLAECERRQGGRTIRLLLCGGSEVYQVEEGAKALLPLQFDF